MHKSANLIPLYYCFTVPRASTTKRPDKASATLSLDRIVCKIKPNMAFHYLRPLSLSPLALSRFNVRKGGNLARPFSDVTKIPIVGYKHPSDVPSEKVLSSLSIFGRWREVPDICTERKQCSDWRSQKAQQQEGKEAQRKDNRNATGDPCPGDSGGGGGEGCTRDPSEQNDQGREHADTWTGNEASAHEASSGSTEGCDGGGGADGGGCDGGL